MIRKVVFYWVPVVVWCAIIFAQSAFATPDSVPNWPYLDKVAHCGVYGLLGALLCRALANVNGWNDRSVGCIALATVLTALYGLSDEWHQSFVVERTAEIADLLADTVGGFIGSASYALLRRVPIRSIR